MTEKYVAPIEKYPLFDSVPDTCPKCGESEPFDVRYRALEQRAFRTGNDYRVRLTDAHLDWTCCRCGWIYRTLTKDVSDATQRKSPATD